MEFFKTDLLPLNSLFQPMELRFSESLPLLWSAVAY